MALAYFHHHDKLVNTETINYVEVIGRTDNYHDDHVIIKFDGGGFLEFPPEVSLHEVFTTLEERNTDG
jgi:hypothetical protein